MCIRDKNTAKPSVNLAPSICEFWQGLETNKSLAPRGFVLRGKLIGVKMNK